MIKTIIPSSPKLKEYIDCFYIYKGDSTSNFKYLAFPHYNTGISFFKGATIQRNHNTIKISETNYSETHIEILGKYTFPVLVEYTGKIQEISIIFKPLGFNRFFKESYQSLAPKFSQVLHVNIWNEFIDNYDFEESNLLKLESFLLSQFKVDTSIISLEKAISLLSDKNDNTSMNEIALSIGYNLKTFQRHFKKHIGCAPVEYRRICRFRNTLSSKLNNLQLKSLTDITYEGGYFDQSYFIKEFKKLTNHNPKDFFKVVKKVDGDKLVWEIK